MAQVSLSLFLSPLSLSFVWRQRPKLLMLVLRGSGSGEKPNQKRVRPKGSRCETKEKHEGRKKRRGRRGEWLGLASAVSLFCCSCCFTPRWHWAPLQSSLLSLLLSLLFFLSLSLSLFSLSLSFSFQEDETTVSTCNLQGCIKTWFSIPQFWIEKSKDENCDLI